ncbi:hypothetical protein BT96DRAFT_75376 [Gymnopus androsaceus JB14]|uniref:Uncharacterized protein n=1 Tax=Gymnopus androsaceus JB14 TaxID=1447944 RepID=A0A6A4HIV0_9AGAR|nr:hypothetical protein BT96DRAFT_75376 [Gymnopus androsaceus JB14]
MRVSLEMSMDAEALKYRVLRISYIPWALRASNSTARNTARNTHLYFVAPRLWKMTSALKEIQHEHLLLSNDPIIPLIDSFISKTCTISFVSGARIVIPEISRDLWRCLEEFDSCRSSGDLWRPLETNQVLLMFSRPCRTNPGAASASSVLDVWVVHH